MNIENINAQMRKGVLELCILAIIKRQEAYASDILETTVIWNTTGASRNRGHRGNITGSP
jgi:hypothetical protein